MPVMPFCCGCAACNASATSGDYLAEFPGTFSSTSDLGFVACIAPGGSSTSYTLVSEDEDQCQHGKEDFGGDEFCIDGKQVSTIALVWTNAPSDLPGVCPRWIFAISFYDSEGPDADGMYYFWALDASDPDDPTGTYDLVCATEGDEGPIMDPADYTAPATITIS